MVALADGDAVGFEVKVVTLKKPQRNVVNLIVHPVTHYRLLVELARRRACGENTLTISKLADEVLFKGLPAARDEDGILKQYVPRRQRGRPKKEVSQESQPA